MLGGDRLSGHEGLVGDYMIGSTWGKWDLHVHSPYTHQANEYSATTIDEYANKVISSNLCLIGVTNYFFFEDNELEEIRGDVKNK